MDHKISLKELILSSWKHSTDPTGRASRMEYWLFVLVLLIISAAIAFVLDSVERYYGVGGSVSGIVGLLFFVIFGALLIPFMSNSARRLHDHGQSGKLLLLWFVPVIGGIIVLIMMMIPGNEGRNDYGDDPRYHTNEIFD